MCIYIKFLKLCVISPSFYSFTQATSSFILTMLLGGCQAVFFFLFAIISNTEVHDSSNSGHILSHIQVDLRGLRGSAEPKANLFLLPLPDFWFLSREFCLRDLFKDN